jgi:hypothetical protein
MVKVYTSSYPLMVESYVESQDGQVTFQMLDKTDVSTIQTGFLH